MSDINTYGNPDMWFDYDEDELEKGRFLTSLTGKSGVPYEVQKGITSDDLNLLESLGSELMGDGKIAGTETDKYPNLMALVEQFSKEDVREVNPPNYQVANKGGGWGGGYYPYPDEGYQHMIHPGTFNQYKVNQEKTNAGQVHQLKQKLHQDQYNIFLQNEFGTTDLKMVHNDPAMQQEVHKRATESAQLSVPELYDTEVRKNYNQKINPLLKKFNFIDSKEDFNRTLTVLETMKNRFAPTTVASDSTIAPIASTKKPKKKVSSDSSLTQYFNAILELEPDDDDYRYAIKQLNEKQLTEFEEYKKKNKK